MQSCLSLDKSDHTILKRSLCEFLIRAKTHLTVEILQQASMETVQCQGRRKKVSDSGDEVFGQCLLSSVIYCIGRDARRKLMEKKNHQGKHHHSNRRYCPQQDQI